MSSRKLRQIIFRQWYYFRLGYGTYLNLPVSLIGYITVIYTLLLPRIPILAALFPHFLWFIGASVVFLTFFSCLFGWIHMKRSQAFSSEQDIFQEENPYNFIVLKGKEEIISYPYFLLALKTNLRLLEKFGCVTEEEKKQFQYFYDLVDKLLQGYNLKNLKRLHNN
jgi:hypothetical protein